MPKIGISSDIILQQAGKYLHMKQWILTQFERTLNTENLRQSLLTWEHGTEHYMRENCESRNIKLGSTTYSSNPEKVISIKLNANKNVTFHTHVGYCWRHWYFLRNARQGSHGPLLLHLLQYCHHCVPE
jgi:hypothetical protein